MPQQVFLVENKIRKWYNESDRFNENNTDGQIGE